MFIRKQHIQFLFVLILINTCHTYNLSAQLTIDPGGLVSIKQGSSMYIGTDFKINAIDGSSGYFSDQTNSGDVTITGNVSVERYMVADIWHNVASPVSNETSAVFAGTDMVWYYDETLIFNDWNFGWVWQPSGALDVFKGYDVLFYTTDVLVDYTGTGGELNTGTYNRGVTLTNSTPSESPEHKGWNLMANPYPSPIDWKNESGFDKSSINDAFYIWDGVNDNYRIWLGGTDQIGINGGTEHIPSNQGFWVQATSNGNFGINNAARTGFITGTPDFYKSQEVFDYPLVSLKVRNDQYSDEVIVRFIEGNSRKFDKDYDASKIFSGNPDVPQISLPSGKDILALNTYSEIKNNLLVSMDFKCEQKGFYTIEMSDRSNLLPNYNVYLRDKVTNELINLTELGEYNFYHDPINIKQRFHIFFNPNLDIINNLQPENYFTVYSNSNKVYLVKNSVQELSGEVVIYNMHGQIIYSKPLSNSTSDSFSLNTKTGYYIVQIRTSETVNNSKIVIFN